MDPIEKIERKNRIPIFLSRGKEGKIGKNRTPIFLSRNIYGCPVFSFSFPSREGNGNICQKAHNNAYPENGCLSGQVAHSMHG